MRAAQRRLRLAAGKSSSLCLPNSKDFCPLQGVPTSWVLVFKDNDFDVDVAEIGTHLLQHREEGFCLISKDSSGLRLFYT